MLFFYDLREECIKEYGEEFGEMYDSINSGIPIGNITETIMFVEMVESVRERCENKKLINRLKHLIPNISKVIKGINNDN